jgi:hypothetical protein
MTGCECQRRDSEHQEEIAVSLSLRLQQVTLDVGDIAQAEPYVLRDLRRVCSLCASKRRCECDLARKFADPVWEEYCPNAPTLHASIVERCNQNQPKAS